jgi:hypothetical protein
MSDDTRKPHPIGGLDWGNCPKCDWFYKFVTLDRCPMCRHPWRQIVGYQQPPFESPGLQ